MNSSEIENIDFDDAFKLSDAFDIVRIVDPAICSVVGPGPAEEGKTDCHCYRVWGKDARCADCTSSRVTAKTPRISKMEVAGSNMYYVISKYIELDGRPLALEMVSQMDRDAISYRSEVGEKLTFSLETLKRQLDQDSVSGAKSRRFWDDYVSKREGFYGVAILDMDNFKNVNDTLGHVWGDRALRLVSHTVMKGIRDTDEFIRYGGDEFVLVLGNVKGGQFERKLNDIRDIIASLAIGDDSRLHLSVSIGGVYGVGSIGQLFQEADDLLLNAKREKGCVIVKKSESQTFCDSLL